VWVFEGNEKHLSATTSLNNEKPELVRTIGRWSLVALMRTPFWALGFFGLPSLICGAAGWLQPLELSDRGCGALIYRGMHRGDLLAI